MSNLLLFEKLAILLQMAVGRQVRRNLTS